MVRWKLFELVVRGLSFLPSGGEGCCWWYGQGLASIKALSYVKGLDLSFGWLLSICLTCFAFHNHFLPCLYLGVWPFQTVSSLFTCWLALRWFGQQKAPARQEKEVSGYSFPVSTLFSHCIPGTAESLHNNCFSITSLALLGPTEIAVSQSC